MTKPKTNPPKFEIPVDPERVAWVHAEADAACGRSWVCACCACRTVRGRRRAPKPTPTPTPKRGRPRRDLTTLAALDDAPPPDRVALPRLPKPEEPQD